MSTVIHVVQHLRPGGIETMALDLVNFREKHERTFIISLEGNKQDALRAWPRLKLYERHLIFMNKKSGFMPVLFIKLATILMKLNVDVVHTHHIGPLIYGGLAARLVAARRLIHTEHDAWHLNDAHHRHLQKILLTLVRPILVADAKSVAENIRSQLNVVNIQVIPNGIDTDRFVPGSKHQAREFLRLPQTKKLIGCSGRLEQVKGQHILIDALHKLPTEVHLALAGCGSMEEKLHRQVKQLGLENRVHFLGRIDDMPTFYQSLDVFCLPSLHEGLPLSPLEAQSCGIPTVVTDVGGSRETLCLELGEYIAPGDAKSMAKSLIRTLNRYYVKSPRSYIILHGDVRLMADRYASLRQVGEIT